MKKKSQSLMSMYSEKPMKKKNSTGSDKNMPLMANYEQRYKGGLSKEFTENKTETLDDKISKRESLKKPKPEATESVKKVSVEINGNPYLLGCTEDISESRIRKIAALANEILYDTKEDNPGLTNTKINALALIDACDRILSLKDENSNLKTELMYLQHRVNVEEEHTKFEPTPMEMLANEIQD